MPGCASRLRAPRQRMAQSSSTGAASSSSPSPTTATRPGAVVDAGGRLITVRAKVIVNAAGVWSDEVRTLDEGADPDSIRPAKGVHLTVPWDKVRNDIAVVIPVPKDKRSLFVVPWGRRPDGTFEHTYVGTTDTDYDGPLDDPQCTKDDITYVLKALNASITTGVTEADITGVWAGLRPLVKSASSGRTADLSRRHKVNRSSSNVISVTGGKLTTYREMAQDTVDEVCEVLGVRHKSTTKRLPLVGADGYRQPADPASAHLADRYGSAAAEVVALGLRRSSPRRAARTRPSVHQGRGRLRGPVRDGGHVGRRVVAPHPRPTVRPPRNGRCRGRRRPTDRRRHGLGRGRDRAPGRPSSATPARSSRPPAQTTEVDLLGVNR